MECECKNADHSYLGQLSFWNLFGVYASEPRSRAKTFVFVTRFDTPTHKRPKSRLKELSREKHKSTGVLNGGGLPHDLFELRLADLAMTRFFLFLHAQLPDAMRST